MVAKRRPAAMGGTMRTAAPPEPLISPSQGRAICGFFGAGLGFLLVGLLLPPQGVVFWVAFGLVPLAIGGMADVLGKRLGALIDRWRLGRSSGQPPVQAIAAAALPDAARLSLQVAAVPALLSVLVQAAPRMPPAGGAAARRLVEAATTAWNTAGDQTARASLARDLPRLVAGLMDGGAEGIQAAEAAARQMAGGPAGRRP
jgi:hypothetical protein